jgi:MFS transporter, DHA3 family, macrolide efflux protein
MTRGWQTLLVMAAALLLAFVGLRVVEFVIAIWVYEHSGSMSQFSLVFLLSILPAIVLSPLGGVLADRWSRRAVLAGTTLGAALACAALAAMTASGRLQVWQVYLFTLVGSGFSALQWPAISATLALLVDKPELPRANSLVQLAFSLAQVLAPLLGGVLLQAVQLTGVLVFCITALGMAVLVLALLRLPRAPADPTTATRAATRIGLADFLAGWRYIAADPALLALALFVIVNTFFMGMVTVLAIPMILGFSSKAVLGSILSIGGVGMVAGCLLIGVRRRSDRLVQQVVAYQVVAGLAMVGVSLTESVPLVMASAFVYFFSLAIVGAYYDAIWQGTVTPALQGRVLSARKTATLLSQLLAYLSAGVVAQHGFEPLMGADGYLGRGLVGSLLGHGPGRGIALLFLLLGLATVLVSGLAWRSPHLASRPR